jgi:hypothetical protein
MGSAATAIATAPAALSALASPAAAGAIHVLRGLHEPKVFVIRAAQN